MSLVIKPFYLEIFQTLYSNKKIWMLSSHTIAETQIISKSWFVHPPKFQKKLSSLLQIDELGGIWTSLCIVKWSITSSDLPKVEKLSPAVAEAFGNKYSVSAEFYGRTFPEIFDFTLLIPCHIVNFWAIVKLFTSRCIYDEFLETFASFDFTNDEIMGGNWKLKI